MKILVSGFEPFGGDPVNPTEQLVAALAEESFAGGEVHTVLLPVTFDECADKLIQVMEEVRPDAVICCGLAKGRTAITPERIAINVKDIPASSYADNSGGRPVDLPIREGGPDGLFATLPIRDMVTRLIEQDIPATLSNTAGTFICNNTMYRVLDYIGTRKLPTLAGFVHFPASSEMAIQSPSVPSLPQSILLKGLRIMVQTTLDVLNKRG
ncbi:pyroglutamyl-peptidase I [Paenibacillus sp. CAA11]|uniref:pyroglutamyl-peptidase I n=1 Tax=Paenibacillus sp. CAA11 TaxID=1532905 RepID=UPI000D3BCF0C|nr:pyroglutamyl-peptidase I [Paenibacillus sp. CAA11]AWB46423.1 pyroglutamyl-peptidase I [Paenibacillus sp. CAA11]